MKRYMVFLFALCELTFGRATGLLDSSQVSATEASTASPISKTAVLRITGDVDHLAFRAVENRNMSQLRAMLREGMSANLRSDDGTTLLMYAALHGDSEGVRILLEAGADANASNGHVLRPLFGAHRMSRRCGFSWIRGSCRMRTLPKGPPH